MSTNRSQKKMTIDISVEAKVVEKFTILILHFTIIVKNLTMDNFLKTQFKMVSPSRALQKTEVGLR